MFDREELEAVASVAREHDLVVISDEVWEHVVLDGSSFTPLATLPGMAERTIKIGSAGKIFSLTGWKVGWMVAAPELANVVARAHQFLTFSTAPNLQAAVAFGLEQGDAWIQPMRDRFQRSRDRMTEGLRNAGFAVLEADATYFLCVDLSASGIGLDDEAFATAAVERAGVAVVPLSAFAERNPPRHLVRLCFGKKDETIDAGVAAMAKAKEMLRMTPADDAQQLLDLFGVDSAGKLVSYSPIDGAPIGRVTVGDPDHACAPRRRGVREMAQRSGAATRRAGPAARRAAARRRSRVLAKMITLEAGKILQESLGEVQEMIDICDFAVGLSRQLYGLTIASERPDHRMMEQWHPLGPVLVITAFNFPVAVWAWNAALALVCGDPVVWKPSEKTPLCAELVMQLVRRALARLRRCARRAGPAGPGRARRSARRWSTIRGSRWCPRPDRPRWAVPSARASRSASAASLLELGGNNAAIVCPSADLELAARAILFSAAGTAGQRCTTLRRLIVHESVAEPLLARAQAAVRIGEDRRSARAGHADRAADRRSGVRCDDRGARRQARASRCGRRADFTFGLPWSKSTDSGRHRCCRRLSRRSFMSLRYRELDEAIALNNAVPQGLSSSIFTNDVREAERFMSASGSDCGIANVNIGPSGAEIGGAFGGEKETGGGRESGSDAWRAYMRRQTNTMNYGSELPLAQGIRFDIAP